MVFLGWIIHSYGPDMDEWMPDQAQAACASSWGMFGLHPYIRPIIRLLCRSNMSQYFASSILILILIALTSHHLNDHHNMFLNWLLWVMKWVSIGKGTKWWGHVCGLFCFSTCYIWCQSHKLPGWQTIKYVPPRTSIVKSMLHIIGHNNSK